MRRKTLSIFFISFYLLFTFGFVVSSHFCGGDMIDMKLMQTADNCYGEASNDNSDCCSTDNETIFFSDHNNIDNSYSFSKSISIVDIPRFETINSDIISEKHQYLCRFLDLPPPDNIPSYILNCSFTFYG